MPPSHIVRVPSNMGYKYFCRNMRTFNVSFLAVLSCIAMIDATSIGNRSPFFGPIFDPLLPNFTPYVALQQHMEVLT